MKYYYFIWSDKNRDYIKKEITSNEAYITLNRYYRSSFVKKLKGKNKELYIVPGANHTDLYDGGDNNYNEYT